MRDEQNCVPLEEIQVIGETAAAYSKHLKSQNECPVLRYLENRDLEVYAIDGYYNDIVERAAS